MWVFPGNASHIGCRPEQQDAYALSDFTDHRFVDHGGYLAVVADGIGGMSHGAEAAQIATSAFLASYQSKSVLREVDESLDQALLVASNAVIEEASRRDARRNMGATLLVALVHEQHLYWRALGDSHLYLCRDGRLSQLNADQNFGRTLQQWVEEGLISQNMADFHPDRKSLQNYLGLGDLDDVERNRRPLPLENGDVILLCTDGVYGILSDSEIAQCLMQEKEPMLAASHLCSRVLAKRHPRQDNLTAVVLTCY